MTVIFYWLKILLQCFIYKSFRDHNARNPGITWENGILTIISLSKIKPQCYQHQKIIIYLNKLHWTSQVHPHSKDDCPWHWSSCLAVQTSFKSDSSNTWKNLNKLGELQQQLLSGSYMHASSGRSSISGNGSINCIGIASIQLIALLQYNWLPRLFRIPLSISPP